MNDLLHRLRNEQEIDHMAPAMLEGADKIEQLKAEVARLERELDRRLEPAQAELLKRALSLACGVTIEDIECHPMLAAKNRKAEVDRLQRSMYDIRLVASDEDAVLSLCDEAIGEDEGE